MKKHRIDKIREVSGTSESEITSEHHQKNVERVVDMIMNVYERLPANPAPVSDSWESLIDQLHNGVTRQSTIIQTETNPDPTLDTKNFLEKSTLIDTQTDTDIYSDLEKEILRKIENGQ